MKLRAPPPPPLAHQVRVPDHGLVGDLDVLDAGADVVDLGAPLGEQVLHTEDGGVRLHHLLQLVADRGGRLRALIGAQKINVGDGLLARALGQVLERVACARGSGKRKREGGTGQKMHAKEYNGVWDALLEMRYGGQQDKAESLSVHHEPEEPKALEGHLHAAQVCRLWLQRRRPAWGAEWGWR
eukprot:2772300-Pleurochrysis_carterae.AAC.1